MSNRALNRHQKWRAIKKWFADNKASGTAFIMAGTLALALICLVLGYGFSAGWDVVLAWLTGEYGGWCWILYIALVIFALIVVFCIHFDRLRKGSDHLNG